MLRRPRDPVVTWRRCRFASLRSRRRCRRALLTSRLISKRIRLRFSADRARRTPYPNERTRTSDSPAATDANCPAVRWVVTRGRASTSSPLGAGLGAGPGSRGTVPSGRLVITNSRGSGTGWCVVSDVARSSSRAASASTSARAASSWAWTRRRDARETSTATTTATTTAAATEARRAGFIGTDPTHAGRGSSAGPGPTCP